MPKLGYHFRLYRLRTSRLYFDLGMEVFGIQSQKGQYQ